MFKKANYAPKQICQNLTSRLFLLFFISLSIQRFSHAFLGKSHKLSEYIIPAHEVHVWIYLCTLVYQHWNRDGAQFEKRTTTHRKKKINSGCSVIKCQTNNVTPKRLYVRQMSEYWRSHSRSKSSTFHAGCSAIV